MRRWSAMLENAWPLVLLGLRIGMAGALYLFLFVAIRALRAEVRARTMAIAPARSVPAPSAVASQAPVAASASRAERAGRAEARDHLQIVAYEADSPTEDGARVAGRSFPLRGPAIIGRSAGNSIVLPEAHVSAHHARLLPAPDGWWVEDLGSTNGTYIGARRVTGRVRLDPSAEVRFGPVVARLVRGAAS